jgi:hypothetical protein
MHEAFTMSLAAARIAVQPAKPDPGNRDAVDLPFRAQMFTAVCASWKKTVPFRPVVIGPYTAGNATDRSPAATVGKS